MIGALPEVLTVGGEDYPIRADYRNILQVFEAFQDPDLQPEEKWIVAIYLLIEDFPALMTCCRRHRTDSAWRMP